MATSSRPSWWRFPAPMTLVGAAILFNLPWLEVQCNSPMGKSVLLTQTGLQTASGGMSKGDGLDKLKQGPMKGMAGAAAGGKDPLDDAKMDKAPLMIAFAILVGGGIFLGLLLPLSGARRSLVAICAVGAMALLGGQMAVGFPVAKNANEHAGKQKTPADNPLAGGGNPFAGGGSAKDNPLAGMMGGDNPLAGTGAGAGDAMSIDVRYTPWYYLTWGCLAAGLILVLAEAATGRSTSPSTAASGPAVVT